MGAGNWNHCRDTKKKKSTDGGGLGFNSPDQRRKPILGGMTEEPPSRGKTMGRIGFFQAIQKMKRKRD